MRANRSACDSNAASSMAAALADRSRSAATRGSALLEGGEQAVELVSRAVDQVRRSGELEEHGALGALDDRTEQFPRPQLALRLHVLARGEERAGDLHARHREAVHGERAARRLRRGLELAHPAV